MYTESRKKFLRNIMYRSQWQRQTIRKQLTDARKTRKAVLCAFPIGFLFTTIVLINLIQPSEIGTFPKYDIWNSISQPTKAQISLPVRSGVHDWPVECNLVINLIISPNSATKTNAGNFTDNIHFSKLAHVLDTLEDAIYSEYHDTCLHFVILPGQKKIMTEIKGYLKQFKWTHGYATLMHSSTKNRLEISPKLSSLDHPGSEMIIIDVEYVTNSIRKDWYQTVKTQRKKYGHCHEIISYSTFDAESVEELREHTKDSTDALLWQGLIQNGILVLSNKGVWDTFATWILSERGYWYLWPSVREPRNKGDLRWEDFNATTVAPWTIWFSRFSVLYDVFTTYPIPNKWTKSESPQTHELAVCNLLKIVSLNGSIVMNKPFSRIEDETVQTIKRFSMKYDNTVSLTIVNEAFLETVESWLCNVDEGEFRPPGLVWVAMDDVSYIQLNNIPNCHTVRLSGGKGRKRPLDFGKAGYWCLMLERAYLVRDLLNEGVAVFLFETDQVWLRDPLPFIRRLRGNGNEVDLVATLDAGRELGGNFLFLNPSLPMRMLYKEVCRRFENEFQKSKVETWQPDQGRLIGNDQTILTHLALYDHNFKRKYPIILRILDQEQFACGQWYRNPEKYNTTRAKSPIMINNNWITGIARKKARLISYGHWFLTNGKCNSSLVRNALEENEERLVIPIHPNRIKIGTRNIFTTITEGIDIAPNSSFISKVINDEKSSP